MTAVDVAMDLLNDIDHLCEFTGAGLGVDHDSEDCKHCKGDPMLTQEQIRAASDLKTEEVYVPEWGGSVLMRGMTGTERDAWEDDMAPTPSTQRYRGKGESPSSRSKPGEYPRQVSRPLHGR